MVIPGGGKAVRTDALPGGWSIVPFGAVLEGGTRNGIYKPKEFHGDGCHIVNMGELFAYPRLDSVPMRRVRITGEELERFGLQVGDLLFARRSLVAEGAGKCAIVCGLREPTVFESSIIRARPNQRVADSYYLYYLFNSPFGTYSLGTILRHVAVAGITGSDLVRLTIPVPPLQTQRAIANVLRALDDKIELNRRMNGTLEAMARAIFKSWFVDFDPVRAKAAGRQPAGMDAETAALFPAAFQRSDAGAVPKGWMTCPLDEIAEFLNGLAMQKFPPRDADSLPVIKIAELRRGSTESSDRGGAYIPRDYIVENGDLLFSWSGSLEARIWAGGRGALNQHLFRVTPAGYPKWFVYHWICEHLPEFQAIAAGKATTMGHIQRHHLHEALAVVPPEAVLKTADTVISPISHQSLHVRLQSRTLAALRDALLPKLLSGQIRVREAEEVIEARA
jgi:type I restriction enzyme S subunit